MSVAADPEEGDEEAEDVLGGILVSLMQPMMHTQVSAMDGDLYKP